MYRWSTAKIGDSKLMSEMEEFVFLNQHKGLTLKAYLMIAQGEKEQGLSILKDYVEATRSALKKERIPNLKAQRSLKQADEVLNTVVLDKKTFPQNTRAKHMHTSRIEHLAFSPSSKSIVTTAHNEVKVWKIQNNLIVNAYSIPGNEPKSEEQLPLSCVNDTASIVVVHRGNLIFTVYNVTGQDPRQTDTIDLEKEVKANGNPGFELVIGDKVTDLRLLQDDMILRVSFTKNKQCYLIDVQLSDSVAQMRKIRRFEDRSAFALNPPNRSLSDTLSLLVDDEIAAGNLLSFPEEESNTVCVLKREDPSDKYLLVFDIRRNGYFRRLTKNNMDCDAFAIDSTGQMVAYLDGPEIRIRLARIPNSSILIDCLRPRYQVAHLKVPPSLASEQKQVFKDKLYRDLHTYHTY